MNLKFNGVFFADYLEKIAHFSQVEYSFQKLHQKVFMDSTIYLEALKVVTSLISKSFSS